MKISNSFQSSTFNLKLLKSKISFLLFTHSVSTKHFSQLTQDHKTRKIKSETSTFQKPKMEMFKSDRSVRHFYLYLLKTFFILKMNRTKAQILNEQLLNAWNANLKPNRSFCIFNPTLPKPFLYSKSASEHLLNTQNGNFRFKYIVVHLLK